MQTTYVVHSTKALLLQSAEYGYDANGNLTSIVDGNDDETVYEYDSMNRLTSVTDAPGTSYEYTYNGDGSLLTRTNPNGSVVEYEYNSAGELTGVIFEDGSEVEYSYYPDGRRMSMTDPNGITEYTYNEVNGLVETITRTPEGGLAQTITYHYDSRNQVDLITYPDEKTAEYTHNSWGQLNSATFTDDTTALDLSYDANGKIEYEELPNGITVDYTYDDSGRLTAISHSSVDAISYTLSPSGTRLSMTTSEGTTEYEYDDFYQLISVDYPDGLGLEYTYDNAGNRVGSNSISSDSAVYLFDDLERLISYSDDQQTIEYKYDGDGNLCEKIVRDLSGEIIAHSQYFYDYSAGLPRVLTELDLVNDEVIDYAYAGRLYGKYDDGMYYYHQDGLGSIVAITDSSGDVINTYSYDAFGDLRSQDETIKNSILFTGEMVDEAGLVYLRARFYDPTIGRFLTRDSYMGDITNPQSLNLYTYCQNDPVNYTDPSGHWKEEIHYDATKSWAIEVGISEEDAMIIAEGDNDVDLKMGTTPWLYSASNQSWHFNLNPGGYDTREEHFETYYNAAVELYKDNETRYENRKCSKEYSMGVEKYGVKYTEEAWYQIYSYYKMQALYRLGIALHPKQDIRAHMQYGADQIEEYGKIRWPHSTKEHPFDLGIYDDPSKDYNSSTDTFYDGTTRYQNTKNDTLEVLKQFIKDVNY